MHIRHDKVYYGIEVFDATVGIILGEVLDSKKYFEHIWRKRRGGLFIYKVNPLYKCYLHI